MATHKHCSYIKRRRKSRFIFPWQVQDHITCHSKCKAWNHRARFSLHTTARHKLVSLYQFISMSLVWAWVCLVQWTPTWTRFESDFMTFSNHLAKWEKKRNRAWMHTYPFQNLDEVNKQFERRNNKNLDNLSLMEWKSARIRPWGGGGHSHFSLFPIQGDLPSYTSEDKSPLGT